MPKDPVMIELSDIWRGQKDLFSYFSDVADKMF